MNEFIEKNRRLFVFYCVAARIIGWLFLIVPPMMVGVKFLSGTLTDSRHPSYSLFIHIQATLNIMLLGLVALGIAQFIRYLCERQYQPAWILRNADKILYIYAVVLVVGAVLFFFFRRHMTWSWLFWELLCSLLPATAKALILVGLSKILRRIMPVIEESKTLV